MHGIIKSAIFANMNQMSQREYIARVMAEIDERSRLETAEEKGIEKGKAEGLAEGREQGRAEGKAEIAKAMLVNGVDIQIITKCTGLSELEIKAL